MSRTVVYVALQQFGETDDRARRALEQAGFEVRLNALGHRLRREEMPEALRGADAVVAGVEPYDAGILAELPQLRVISRCGAGTDAIDLEAAGRRRIAVLTTPKETVEPVAQLALAMILGLARNLALHAADARAGQWKKRTGVLLSEWTVGLVGFGRIGQAVAQYLRPFGCRMLASDPALAPDQAPADVELLDLRSLLARADLVSLHASRRAADGPLIGARELAAMKPGAMLVNTSRGTLVDDGAL
jgi:phosphoglycerate dehydrogenase-like enzyme